MFIIHNNSQKRICKKDFIYFITTKTFNGFPYFKEEIFCQLVIEELRIVKELKQFDLYAFVVLLDHIHLLLRPNGKDNISNIMHFLKRHFSRNANIIIGLENNFSNEGDNGSTSNEGDNGHCRLQYDGLNQKISLWRKQFLQKYGYPQYEIPRFRWQKSFYDHYIRNEKDCQNHINYIAGNPVKHGLVEDESRYQWSFLNPMFNGLIN